MRNNFAREMLYRTIVSGASNQVREEGRAEDGAGFSRSPAMSNRLLIAVLLLIGLANVLLTWAQIELVWGDVGRWLSEIDRYAQGQSPYRDFFWAFPPMMLWLLGGYARIFGSEPSVIWLATSAIFMLLILAYGRYVTKLLDESVTWFVAISGLLLALGYVHSHSAASLPMGSYMPGVTLGVLFLVLGLSAWLNLSQTPNNRSAAVLGLMCGVAILTKQDFWLPAAYLVLVTLVQLRTPSGARNSQQAVLVSCFLVTLLGGALLVTFQSGLSSLLVLPGGAGMAAAVRGRAFPSGERLALNLFALSMWSSGWFATLGAFAGNGFSRRIRWGLFVSVVVTISAFALLVYKASTPDSSELLSVFSMSQLTRSIGLTLRGVQTHFLPLLLPLAMMVAVWFRRTSSRDQELTTRVLFLLGFCLALRGRRLFELMEWFHALIELPVYAAAVGLFVTDKLRARVVVMTLSTIWLVAGLYSYWYFGVGQFTRRAPFTAVSSARGTIYLANNEAIIFNEVKQVVQEIDPEGRRPLFGVPHSGAFGYFLSRQTPGPLTTGFFFSNFDPDRVLQNMKSNVPPILVLDHEFSNDFWPSPQVNPSVWLGRWKLAVVPSPWASFDRRYMDRLLKDCPVKHQFFRGDRVAFTLHDCAN